MINATLSANVYFDRSVYIMYFFILLLFDIHVPIYIILDGRAGRVLSFLHQFASFTISSSCGRLVLVNIKHLDNNIIINTRFVTRTHFGCNNACILINNDNNVLRATVRCVYLLPERLTLLHV